MELTAASLMPFFLAALSFVLLRALYYYFGIIICIHPITPGVLAWLFTGNIEMLLVALFFELLWLDLFYVGTYVPPDGLFAYLLAVPIMMHFGLAGPGELVLPLLAALPFATLLSKYENRLRLKQSAVYIDINRVIDERGDIEGATEAVWRKSLARLVVFGFLFYALAAMSFFGALSLWMWKVGDIYRAPWASWGLLLSLAAVGGLLSLRISLARVSFGASALVVGGLYIFYA